MIVARGSGVTHAREDRLWQLSSDLMVVAETTGVLLAVNSAWQSTLGWTDQELIELDIRDLVHPDDVEATEAELDSLAGGSPTTRFENRLRHKDGGYRHISWRCAPADGLIYGVGRDISERLEREEALRQSQKMEAVGQLAGGISHDFNNLLTILRSSVEFLEKPELSAERRDRYLAAMRTTVDRAVKLNQQLLAFARRQKLEPEIFEVGEKLADVSQLLRPLIGDAVQIYTHVPRNPCFVEADICQLETSLINLAINARDAMAGRGEIHMSVRCGDEMPAIRGHAAAAGEFVVISVRDNGPGISPEMRDKVFEPFFTTKMVGQGTGLGLSQVYGFVKQSGGNIVLESGGEADDETGAIFTIYLPRSPYRPAIADPVRPGNPASQTGCLRVLVVEDNEEVGAFCANLLTDLGQQPTWARNASEALRVLADNTTGFDVVLSDIVMPGMSGMELAEHLRNEAPHLPVVLTSGYSQVLADGGTRGFKLLGKPYSPDELSMALRQAVSDQ